MTWGWQKLLQLRPIIRDHIRYRIGDGATCSLWFNWWSSSQPLAAIVSNRDIHRLDLIFILRPRAAVVNWFDVVWFTNCIPRHAFHMWLVAKCRLKTQDLLRPWDVNGAVLSMHCPLCDGQPDSHEHLFFECVFSKQVWDLVKSLAGLPNAIGSISSIVDLLIPFAKRRSIRSVVAKLVVAACSYYLWQKHNLRLFMNQKRSHSQVTDSIKSSIRLKLLLRVFKKSRDALLIKRLWDLPDSIFW
nr:hypothetical protein [Tanacetum cinerariifolium]